MHNKNWRGEDIFSFQCLNFYLSSNQKDSYTFLDIGRYILDVFLKTKHESLKFPMLIPRNSLI